jgi:hypothetical protein
MSAKQSVLYIDQYGSPFWARTIKELRHAVGGGRVSEMYVDKMDGRTVHCGYVVGEHWLSAYVPLEREVP